MSVEDGAQERGRTYLWQQSNWFVYLSVGCICVWGVCGESMWGCREEFRGRLHRWVDGAVGVGWGFWKRYGRI